MGTRGKSLFDNGALQARAKYHPDSHFLIILICRFSLDRRQMLSAWTAVES